MSSLQQLGKGHGSLNWRAGTQLRYMGACRFSRQKQEATGRRHVTFPTFGVTITDFL